MKNATQTKWDAIYQHKDIASQAPAQVLLNNTHLLPQTPKPQALEIACGLAGNSFLLAEKGFSVDAWDISSVVIEKIQANPAFSKQIKPLACDVTEQAILANHYDLVIVSRFLERTLIPRIIKGLKPGGLIFYQTYIKDKASPIGPTSSRFLLEKNELLHLFSSLCLVSYREEATIGDLKLGFRNEALLISQKPLS